MDADALKAKLSLAFEMVASCSICRFHFDIEKYRIDNINVSDFGDVKNVCRNQDRLSNLHLKGEDDDGFIAIYECPEEDICEYWRPIYDTIYVDPKLTSMEIHLDISNKTNVISDNDVLNIAKELGFGGIKLN